MKRIIQLEEAAQLAIAVVGLSLSPVSVAWYLWPVLFLSPDVSMLGYLAGTKVGAMCYNLFHHKATAVVVIAVGLFTGGALLQFVGLLLFAHSAFDRLFGYGLKLPDSFQHTHLGWVGKKKVVAS